MKREETFKSRESLLFTYYVKYGKIRKRSKRLQNKYFFKHDKKEEDKMKEKVLWVELPEDSEYQKVMVTGRQVDIVYLEKCACQSKKVLKIELPEGLEYQGVRKEKERIGIVCLKKCTCHQKAEAEKPKAPKPKPCIRGGEVYCVVFWEYWLCKSEDGTRKFTQLCLEDLTFDDLIYDYQEKKGRVFYTKEEKTLANHILYALNNKPTEPFVWVEHNSRSILNSKGKEYPIKDRQIINYLSCLRWLKDGRITLKDDAERLLNIMHKKENQTVTK